MEVHWFWYSIGSEKSPISLGWAFTFLFNIIIAVLNIDIKNQIEWV